jgi:hypothetical protein
MASWRLRGFPEVLTDAGGQFVLTGLSPGSYNVRATRSQRRGRGGRGMFGPGTVTAQAGDTGVRIELPADGAVTGKVALEDGSAPTAFTVSMNFATEPFATRDGAFLVQDVMPGDYELQVRGAGFAPAIVKATVKAGETVDVGTVNVKKGRTIRGVVLAGGTPVPGATVYVGASIFGTGSSNEADFGGPPGARETKKVTADDAGQFQLEGFNRRDLTVVAEHEAHGRSKALRLVMGDPAEQQLQLQLLPFGVLVGTVRDGGKIAEGIIIQVQSTTAPGASYGVVSGADGTFRLDRLAPDRYKVSALTGMNPMRGLGFFSRTIDVEGGKETRVDVTMSRGAVTLTAVGKSAAGEAVSGIGYLVSGTVAARTGRDLDLSLAQQGEGTSNFGIMFGGQPATFRELVPGNYTVCLMPLPAGLQGMQAMGYSTRHRDELPAFCKAVAVAASPAQQAITIDVELPPLLPDE